MGQLSNKTIMTLNIKRLLRLKGERTSDLSRAINTPYTTVAEWVNGRAYPRIDKIEAMAGHCYLCRTIYGSAVRQYLPEYKKTPEIIRGFL